MEGLLRQRQYRLPFSKDDLAYNAKIKEGKDPYA